MNFPTLYAPMGSPYAALTSADPEAGGYGGGGSGGQRRRQQNAQEFNPFLVATTESDLDNAQWLGNTWIYQQDATQYLYVMTHEPQANDADKRSAQPTGQRHTNPFLATV